MFYYFGSKARLASTYEAPRYPVIVEPFAGSAGYSCLHHTHAVILVEADARVVALWRQLMRMSPAEVLTIPAPQVGVRSTDLLVMLRAASEHSLTGAYITVTERMVSRWGNLLRRMADMIPKVQHWQIIEGDYTAARTSRPHGSSTRHTRGSVAVTLTEVLTTPRWVNGAAAGVDRALSASKPGLTGFRFRSIELSARHTTR